MRRRRLLSTAGSPLWAAGSAGLLAAATGCTAASAGSNAAKAAVNTATIELEKGGTITIQLFPDVAPRSVQNFVDKANKGFYSGLTFWRVEDWVIQGGDPAGNGTGGNRMPSDLNDRPFDVGAVGMARTPEDPRIQNDAQFFICLKQAFHLNKQYTNFGQVIDGLDRARQVHPGDKIKKITVK